MTGRKRKPDSERFQKLTTMIQQDEKHLSDYQSKVDEHKQQRLEILSHLIVGQMEERHLNFPEVESILTQLFKGEPPDLQKAMIKVQMPSVEREVLPDSNSIAELKVRVSQKEKAKIYANMKKAHYSSFNSFAKKLLLDGYLILWASPETRELKKELSSVNRNLNQLVKRANATGSIYAGDFQDILSCCVNAEK